MVVVVGDVINDFIVRPQGPVDVGTDTPSEIERSAWWFGSQSGRVARRTGTPVRFAGRVGARTPPTIGKPWNNSASTPGSYPMTPPLQARSSYSCHLDGERSMFTDRGANRGLRAADCRRDCSTGQQLLHVSGYQLFEPGTRSAVRDLWATALEAGIPTSVDPASVSGLREVGAQPFLEWTSGARLVFPNLEEGRVLTGLDDPGAIVVALLESYPIVALKLGAAGALVAATDGRLVPVAAQPTEVVDCTGRGRRVLRRLPYPLGARPKAGGLCAQRGHLRGQSHRAGAGAPETELTAGPGGTACAGTFAAITHSWHAAARAGLGGSCES